MSNEVVSNKRTSVAVYAGSFDPPTLGHLNIIERAAKLCDKLIVVVAVNFAKKALFSALERVDLLNQEISDLAINNVEVTHWSELIVSFAKCEGATLLIRGIRSSADFEYENQLAFINRNINPSIDTIFLPTEHSLSLVSSSVVKELARYSVPIDKMVSKKVADKIAQKYKTLGVHE